MFKSLLLKGRTLCVLILCTLSSLVVTAQTRITGKVIGSDDKQPIIGATVKIKGTNVGVVTDVNGDFTLSGKTGYVLVISYIGYQSKDVTVDGPSLGTITLEVSNRALNEVVVTGYTSQLKKDISGSVAVVDVNDAKKINATTAEQLLQGQAAGVTVINSGAPGAPSTVFIRGTAGFGNTTPLYVVDGVQVGDMSQVNPTDIESISVLKDAGTAAIYGISGGNGVVIVTTKKGKSGKTTISYNGFYGVQEPLSGNVWHLINPSEQSTLAYRAGDPNAAKLYPGGAGTLPTYGYQGVGGGSFGAAGVTNDPSVVALYKFDAGNPGNDFLVQKFNQSGTDWFHAVFKAAPTDQHTITASGGTDKSTYLFSLNYVNQKGTLLNDYEKRYAVRVNTTTSGLNNHVRVGENGFVAYEENNGGYNGTQQNEGGTLAYTYRELPIIPIYDVSGIQFGGGYDGPTGEPLGNGTNPYMTQAQNITNNAHFVRVEGNIFAEADIAKYFTVRTSIGGLLYNQYYWNIGYNPYSNYETHTNQNGNSENEQMSTNYNWTNTIVYKESFGKHNIQALGGYEQKDNHGRQFSAYNSGLFSLDPNFVELGQGTPSTPPVSLIYQPIAVESFFGKVDYNYDGKYILSGTIRRDATSIFAPGHQVGIFPSATVGWRISQENFLKGVTWLNDLKLRGSYGIAGSYGDVGGGNAYSQYNFGFGSSYYGINGTNAIQQGFFNSQIGNPNVTWEKYKLTNIGIDGTVFNHLEFTVEWYNKTVSGFLFSQGLPATTGGAVAPIVNEGDVKNTGVDISATYHGRVNNDFTFSIGANITSYKNTILSESNSSQYFDTSPTHGSSDNIVRDEVGHPISSFYGYQVIGIYQNAAQLASGPSYAGAAVGSFIYKDTNGDGKITSADKTFIGNANPTFTYGLNLNAAYKRFDFTMVLYGSQGNKDYNYTKYWTDFYYTFNGGKSQALYNNAAIVANGVVTNPSATLPSASYQQSLGSNAVSSYYVENGSFLKCRVAQLGYTFDPGILKRIGVDKLHVYAQATNLFTITKYDGLDPEMQVSLNLQQGSRASSAYGVDYGAYPNNQKQYIFGVDFTF